MYSEKYLLVVTCIKQPPTVKDQYFMVQNVHVNGILTCVKQPLVFKCNFTMSLD